MGLVFLLFGVSGNWESALLGVLVGLLPLAAELVVWGQVARGAEAAPVLGEETTFDLLRSF